MTKRRIAITLAGDLWEQTEKYARSLGYQVDRRVIAQGKPEGIVDAVNGYDAIVAAIDKYTPEVIEKLTTVKILARIGVGYDNINVPAATKKNIAVTITPGANAVAVAEMAVSLMLAVCRKVCSLDRSVRVGGGYGGPLKLTSQLYGTKVGLVGFGNVGKNLVKILRGFDCEVFVSDPYVEQEVFEEYQVKSATIDEICTSCDFISVHLPYSKETDGIFDASFFQKMKKTAVFVNTARGPLVKEKDLIAALKSGTIAGAGLDVFVNEPLEPGSEFRSLDNVVLTPHYSAMTVQAFNRMGLAAIDNIHQYFQGKKPIGIVNPEVYKEDGK